MIKQVYDLMKNLSKEHKLINTFRYDRLSKTAGTGEDYLPLCFLEMPIYFGRVKVLEGVIPIQFNFNIVLNPQAMDNFKCKPLTPVTCQEIASQIAQQYIARIRNLNKKGETPVNIIDYSILTLQRWYDDNSYGVRVTVNAEILNEINFCLDEDYFDPEKEFKKDNLLESVNTDDAEGCVSLSYKLPKINL